MSISNSNIGEDYTISFYKNIKDGTEKQGTEIKIEPFNSQSVNSPSDIGSPNANTYVGDGARFLSTNMLIISGRESERQDGSGNKPGSARIYKYKPTSPDSDGQLWVEHAAIDYVPGQNGMSATDRDIYFGHTIDVTSTGDYIAIGAPYLTGDLNDTPGDTGRGGVFIFQSGAAGYSQEKVLQPFGEQSCYFGSVIDFDVSSNRLAVGVPNFTLTGTASYSGTNHGIVCVFKSSSTEGWLREVILTSSQAAATQYFGSAVAFSGSYLLSSEPSRQVVDNGTHNQAGMVYIFKSSSAIGWDQIGIISSSNPVTNGYFGRAVRLFSEKRAIIGEEGGHTSGADDEITGSAQIVQFADNGTITRLAILTNPITGANQHPSYTHTPSYAKHLAVTGDGSYIAVSRASEPEHDECAILVYKSEGTNSWNLSKTLTRNLSLATYYGSGTPKWRHDDNLSRFYSSLDILDGSVLFGCNAAAGSDLNGVNNYQVGEFRIWQKTSITKKTQAPFSVGGSFPWNLRGQTTANAYSTTTHKGSGLKS